MTESDFNTQLDRLRTTWPQPSNWSPEKLKLIWQAVNHRNSFWFEKTVTNMISTYKGPPTPNNFLEAERVESRRLNIGKYNLNIPKHPSEKSIFSDQDRKEMFTVMKGAMDGKISGSDAIEYAKMIYQTLKEKGVRLDYRLKDNGNIVFDET